MKSPNFKDYFLLIRLPNLFTLPSNILVGFAIASSLTLTITSLVQVLLLVTISILLYCVGLVLNDLFDYNIDKKERPDRPLASGKISRKIAIVLVTIFSVIALGLSILVSVPTFGISLVLIALIFGYDKYLKNTQAGPFTIAAARMMNVMLGTSASFNNIDSFPQFVILVFVLTITFVYVSLIGFISKYEVQGFSENIKLYLIRVVIAGIISSITLFTFIGFFKYESLIILALFLFIMTKAVYRIENKDSKGIQQCIQKMIMSIIVLDSTYLSGIIGLAVGLAVLLLIAPLLIMSRKMYMT
ncbi:MAG TPA: UbiA family prenyltransferase [Nitrososphaeraceae archaeon]|nr:UbiA family prenyltransferase [Nitrososphaeraceae archaeon]